MWTIICDGDTQNPYWLTQTIEICALSGTGDAKTLQFFLAPIAGTPLLVRLSLPNFLFSGLVQESSCQVEETGKTSGDIQIWIRVPVRQSGSSSFEDTALYSPYGNWASKVTSPLAAASKAAAFTWGLNSMTSQPTYFSAPPGGVMGTRAPTVPPAPI